MKAMINLSVVCILSAMLVSACAPSSRVVRERPVVVRAAPPYPGSVWITEEYRGRPGRYRYVAPHYERGRVARVWAPGYWSNGQRGQRWVKGYWR